MNDNTIDMAPETVGLDQSALALDHFVLGLDDEGNEVKIKIDEAGELSHVQEVEDAGEEVTLN